MSKTATAQDSKELERKTNNIKEDLTDLAHTAQDAAAKRIELAKEQVSEAASQKYEEAKLEGAIKREELEDYVAKQPLKSLAIAAAAGAVLSMFLRRR